MGKRRKSPLNLASSAVLVSKFLFDMALERRFMHVAGVYRHSKDRSKRKPKPKAGDD